MTLTARLAGVFPVVHTPFDEQDEIDWESLQREVEWALSVGADGLVTGMVSELLRLEGHERRLLTERLMSMVHGRRPVVVGVGSESTKNAIAHAVHAYQHGCAAVMAVPPTTARVSEQQLVDYFDAIARSVPVPLIVQDASSYVGQSIPLAVCVELIDRFGPERIWFKPEATPIGPHISALLAATQQQARIFEGSGGIALVDSFRRGIVGTMPGMEFLPGIVALWKALHEDDQESVYDLYLPLCALVSLQLQMGLDGFLAVEKYVMKRRGLFRTENRRGPYHWSLDAVTCGELDRLLGRLEQAVSSYQQQHGVSH